MRFHADPLAQKMSDDRRELRRKWQQIIPYYDCRGADGSSTPPTRLKVCICSCRKLLKNWGLRDAIPIQPVLEHGARPLCDGHEEHHFTSIAWLNIHGAYNI
jgi:hypothetical protein